MNMELLSKRKKKKKMNASLPCLFARRSPKNLHLTSLLQTKKRKKKKMMMNIEEAEAEDSSNKVVPSKRKKMFKEEAKSIALRTSNKVMNYLNDDIINFILSKLPLKSLKRFECVCKSWATLFQDSYFNKLYTNNFISNNHNHYDHTYLLLQDRFGYTGLRQFYLLPDQRFEDKNKIDWPSPCQDGIGIHILGTASINGIFCFNQIYKRQFIMWNPATGESKVIPYTRCERLPPNRQPMYDLSAFGYDHVTNDYKVMQFVDSYIGGDDPENEEYVYEDKSSYETYWEIYSLRSNSWRRLDINIPNRYYIMPRRSIGAYSNGVCHWWAITDDTPNLEDIEEYLWSFNFINERMITTQGPSYLDLKVIPVEDRCLAFLNESIALISTDLEMATVDISILGELGVRESWTKLLTMHLPSIEYPIGVGNLNNRVLFKKNDNKLAWVDLNTKLMEELDVKAENYVFFCVGKYKRSFLPMEGMNN